MIVGGSFRGRAAGPGIQESRPGTPWILGVALTGSAGFSATQVGKIHVNEHAAYVAVERSIAPLALQKLSQGKVKGRSFKVRLLDAMQR